MNTHSGSPPHGEPPRELPRSGKGEYYAIRLSAGYSKSRATQGDLLFVDAAGEAEPNRPCILWISGKPYLDRLGRGCLTHDARHPVVALKEILTK